MNAGIVFIALFAAVFGVLYMYYTTRHKERLALIEKGADASLFNTGKEGSGTPINWSRFTLKIGMLLIGIAIGITAGATLSKLGIMNEESMYFSMILFFGGLSLVLFYLIDKKAK